MLYVTTRGQADPHTAYKTLHNNISPDGGRYVPFRFESFSENEIASLKDKSFGQTVADILNYFFSAQLTAWDVESCIGRSPHKLLSMNRKIVIAQTWRNPGLSYRYIVNSLYRRICQDTTFEAQATDWVSLAVRIAVLFGVFGELMRCELLRSQMIVDVAVAADDFLDPMAVLYAKAVGLPVGTIICACSHGCVWDLIHKGEVNTNQLSEDLALNLERLLHAYFGYDAVQNFRNQRSNRDLYSLDEISQGQLRAGVFASVIGNSRVGDTINSVYRTNASVLDPHAALAYSGIQDFRAKTGANNVTLLFSDNDPMAFSDKILEATGISQEMLTELCNKN